MNNENWSVINTTDKNIVAHKELDGGDLSITIDAPNNKKISYCCEGKVHDDLEGTPKHILYGWLCEYDMEDFNWGGKIEYLPEEDVLIYRMSTSHIYGNSTPTDEGFVEDILQNSVSSFYRLKEILLLIIGDQEIATNTE